MTQPLIPPARQAQKPGLVQQQGSGPPNGLSPENTCGQTYAQLLRRPEIGILDLWPILHSELLAESDSTYQAWLRIDTEHSARGSTQNAAETALAHAQTRNELRAIETEIKYAGYLDQQRRSIQKLKASEAQAIPADFRYEGLSGLSREMQEKLERIRPSTIGQASRIPGVTPAALTLINVFVEMGRRSRPATSQGQR